VTESIMGSLPPSRAGVGSAVNDSTRQTGGALGVAVLGSVFASHYHRTVATVAGLPAGAASQLHDSIGSAQDAAKTLPAGQADAVRDAAHHAFLSSGRVTFALASVVVVGAIVVASRWLPARAEEPALADAEAEGATEILGSASPVSTAEADELAAAEAIIATT
jgi:hypothetical protein